MEGKWVSYCCYALLDWDNDKCARRNQCICHGIINGDEQVSEGFLSEYFVNNPQRVSIAEDVGWNYHGDEYEHSATYMNRMNNQHVDIIWIVMSIKEGMICKLIFIYVKAE